MATFTNYFGLVQEMISEHSGSTYDFDNIGVDKKKMTQSIQFGGFILDAAGVPVIEEEYVRKWLVVVKSKELTSKQVEKAPGLPLPLSPYISQNGLVHNLKALLVKRESRQMDIDDWQRWEVTDKYSSFLPEVEKPDIKWGYDETMEAPVEDLDGKLYQNTALQPFIPQPQFPSGNRTLTVIRNFSSFDPDKAEDYCWALNKDVFLGYPPQSVLCCPPVAEQMWKKGRVYWRVTFKFKFQKRKTSRLVGDQQQSDIGPQLNPGNTHYTWQPRLLDQGMSQLVKTPKVVVSPSIGALAGVAFAGTMQQEATCHILDDNAIPINHAVMLDGKGHRAIPGLVPVVQNGIVVDIRWAITPVWLDFRQFRKMTLRNLLEEGIS